MALSPMKRLGFTALIRYFGLRKVALILYTQPSVIDINDDRFEVKIPLTRRTRNHVNSMYIGAMTVGVDLAVGMLTTYLIKKTGKNIILIFKEFNGKYLKRAEGDVHFICEEGQKISKVIHQTLERGERMNVPITVKAIVPDKFGSEPVAEFIITLSLKEKKAA